MRQSVFRIRLPCTRPSANHSESAATEAATAPSRTCQAARLPVDREGARDHEDRDRRDRQPELLEQHDAEDERKAIGGDGLGQGEHRGDSRRIESER